VISDEELRKLEARLEKALSRGGHPRLMTPLPWRTRLRLAAERAADRAGCWLCGHRMGRAAVTLWRVTGMWRRLRSRSLHPAQGQEPARRRQQG
jgi:hypothetical protein